MQKVLFIYIERDELDTAVSILNARKKYNTDLNVWWSYQPLEYESIKDQDYWTQIAGQIYYLQRFYKREMERLPARNHLSVTYKEMCMNPGAVIEKIQEKCKLHEKFDLPVVNQPPEQFPYRQYNDSTEEKNIFKAKLDDLRNS